MTNPKEQKQPVVSAKQIVDEARAFFKEVGMQDILGSLNEFEGLIEHLKDEREQALQLRDGQVALILLGIAKSPEHIEKYIKRPHEDVRVYHLLIQAMKLKFQAESYLSHAVAQHKKGADNNGG